MTGTSLHGGDEHLEFIDDVHFVQDEERLVLCGTIGSPIIRKDSDEMVLRVGPFAYVYELFSDADRSALSEASFKFSTCGFVPETMVSEDSAAVMTHEEFRAAVEAEIAEFDDPAVISGTFSPGGSYQLSGNGANDKPRRIASMAYPEDAFTAPGTMPLKKLGMSLLGTVIVERNVLSDEANEVINGERESIDLEDRHPDRMDTEEIHDVLDSLSEGDRVTLNDRSRSMEFTERRRGLIYLKGNGTTYHIDVSVGDRSRYPRMTWASGSDYVTKIDVETATSSTEEADGAAV